MFATTATMTTAAKGRDQEDQRSVTSVCTDEVPLVTTRKVDVQHSKIRRLFWNRETKAALLLIVSMGLITWLVPKWNVRTHTYNLPPEIVKGEYKCDYWGRDDDQFDRVDLETMKDRYERGALVLLKGICVANKRQFTVPLSTSSSAVYWIEEEINGKAGSEYPSYLTHKLVSATSNNAPLITFLCPNEYGVANCEPCTIAENAICSANYDDASILNGF